MARTKATVRKLPVIVNQQQRIGNNNILNIRLRNMPFKIKRIRPRTKRVDAKKNGQVVRQMNVRREAIY